ncbi:hypothetical protein ACI3KS_18325 [Microbacterium sp. ZW T5_45]|uniref:hypothetical protein n=1 Tax=Microbacterium sp. ZW T5_45 TaxID=3378080 RepID=UPI003852372D
MSSHAPLSNEPVESPPGLPRARYRWLWPLTAVNVVCVALAVIGATVPIPRLIFLFPQVGGFLFGPGMILGPAAVAVILICGIVNARRGVDRRDRRYRFLAGLTLSSSIMFATCFVPMAMIFLRPI